MENPAGGVRGKLEHGQDGGAQQESQHAADVAHGRTTVVHVILLQLRLVGTLDEQVHDEVGLHTIGNFFALCWWFTYYVLALFIITIDYI